MPSQEPAPEPPPLAKLAKDVDPKTVATIAAVVQAQISQFTSPLPDPNVLARYDEIVPGAAERIIKMTEGQSTHRQKIESQTITAHVGESNRGQWIAAIITLLFLAGSIWVTLEGHDLVGGVLGGATVVGVVTAFLGSKQQQRKDLRQKRFGAEIAERLKASTAPGSPPTRAD